MDAFYASVEQRDNPALRGRPIAVGSDGPRGVVATASYEARPYGVHSALSSARARRLCPGLIFVRPRFDVYKAVSQQIRDIFHDYTDLVEPLSLDEAFLDVSHERSATLVAREIKARILAETQLTASAGISVNKMLAKIASDYRKPTDCSPSRRSQIEAFVATLRSSASLASEPSRRENAPDGNHDRSRPTPMRRSHSHPPLRKSRTRLLRIRARDRRPPSQSQPDTQIGRSRNHI